MPYKDKEKARQRAREYYQKIKNDPIRLGKRRKRQKLAMRKWRAKNIERSRQLVRESQKRNYDREKNTAYQREWRKNHPYNYQRYREKNNELDRQKRIKIIVALGEKCQECGIADIRVLHGHHIYGRKKNESSKWWRHPPPLDEIKLLCANCHIIEHRENK